MMDYKSTLNLPKTDFPMKARLAEREPERLKKWDAAKLNEKIQEKNAGRELFLLHDGPPYANGHIHFGHILNKVLKDIIVKFRSMSGWSCPFIPGWDCHGLPIEHQVDKTLGKKEKGMTKLQIRQACRDYAGQFVEIQKKEFRRLGIFGDWENPYLTMDFAYEADIARAFADFVEKGAIYRGKKPVLWCAHCRTALAEAEVEYADHRSPSIFVKFSLGEDALKKLPELEGRKASVVIWTTTPWTLPANLAVAFHPSYDYVAVASGDEVFIVANNLLSSFQEVLGDKDCKVVKRFSAAEIEGTTCRHPLLDRDSLIMLSNHVTMDTGTGCVHIAPGHGEEDYELGLQYGLEAYTPVDDEGRFTGDVGLSALVGKHVFKTNRWINDQLQASGHLVKEEELEHSYPHCWRCKNPVIFRATAQWFLSLNHDDLRERALDCIRRAHWIPDWGRDRIYNMVHKRPDWCLSRQRSWGVPIMAFECQECGEDLLDAGIIRKIADRIEEEGADIWFDESKSLTDDLPHCPKCSASSWKRVSDILDVWFDSGISYIPVVEKRLGLELPVDLYIEGSDQHRGWFHSSLLTAVGLRQKAPYKSVLTHGFVVDGKGLKYSKSARNYIPPEKVLSESGAEVLRLWVAAEDYRSNIRVSEEIIGGLREAYRKVRNTCRFLLGNLSDFDPRKDCVSYENMDEMDQYALHLLQRLIARVTQAYEDYAFHMVFHEMNRFCTVDMSAFYLDIMKDRLYTMPATGSLRRSAQTVVSEIVRCLSLLMAPVLSFTADEVWEHIPDFEGKAESVHLADMPEANASLVAERVAEKWAGLREIREEVLPALEQMRQAKVIGNSLEARVKIFAGGPLGELLESYRTRLADIFIVSQVELVAKPFDSVVSSEAFPDLAISVEKAHGEKCERCWKWSTTVGQDPRHATLCHRCTQILIHA